VTRYYPRFYQRFVIYHDVSLPSSIDLTRYVLYFSVLSFILTFFRLLQSITPGASFLPFFPSVLSFTPTLFHPLQSITPSTSFSCCFQQLNCLFLALSSRSQCKFHLPFHSNIPLFTVPFPLPSQMRQPLTLHIMRHIYARQPDARLTAKRCFLKAISDAHYCAVFRPTSVTWVLWYVQQFSLYFTFALPCLGLATAFTSRVPMEPTIIPCEVS